MESSLRIAQSNPCSNAGKLFELSHLNPQSSSILYASTSVAPIMATQYHDDIILSQFPRAHALDCPPPDVLSFLDDLSPSACRGYLGVNDLSNELLADTLALILQQFCRSNSLSPPQLPHPSDPAALFFSPAKQTSFTLSFYCRRLLEYNCCSKSCFVVAILYLARLATRCPIFEVNEFNVHRLICTAVVLAAKWLDDVSYANSHYAKVAGVQTTAEMTRMEHHMLKSMDYRLFVTKENFEEVEGSLLQIAANWV